MRAPEFDPQPIVDAQATKGWSAERLAAEAGTSFASVYAICSGRKKPRGETLARICHALSIPMESCFEWKVSA